MCCPHFLIKYRVTVLSAAAAVANSVSSPISQQTGNAVLMTSSKTVSDAPADSRPFSPSLSRHIYDQPTSPPSGYRRVAAPNPDSVKSNASNDYQSSRIASNQNKPFGASLQTPASLSTNRATSAENGAASSSKISASGGHMTQGQQRSDVYGGTFRPEMSQDSGNVRLFSAGNAVDRPVEAARNANQKSDDAFFYQNQPPIYQPSEASAMSQARPASLQNNQGPFVNYQRPEPFNVSGSSQVQLFGPQTSQVPAMNYQHDKVNYQKSETSTITSQRSFSPETSQVPITNYQRPETFNIPASSQARPFSPQTSQVPDMVYQSNPSMNYEQSGTSTMFGSLQAQHFSLQNTQVPSVNYQQSEVSTMLQANPISPQNNQVHAMNYQRPETSTMAGPSHARPFSPQTNQIPAVNYQPRPVNYQQFYTSAMSESPQAQPQSRPFPLSNYQPQTVNHRHPVTSDNVMPGLVQTRHVTPQPRPQISQVASANYKSPPPNYQQSTMPSSLPQGPLRPQTSQMPVPNVQSQPRAAAVSARSQVRPLAPRVGVKQHVQRFSAPGGTPVNNRYPPPPQQFGIRQGAPAVTSHASYDVRDVRAQGRPFSPRDDRFVQSPSQSKVQGQTRSPSAPPIGYLPPGFNANVVPSLEQRPFSPRVVAGYELRITEPGNNKHALAEKISSAANKPITPTEVNTKLTDNIDTRGQMAADSQVYNTPRNQTQYRNDGPTLESMDNYFGQKTDNRSFSPQGDQRIGQPAYQSVTSATFAARGSSVGQRIEVRPFSPPIGQKIGQTVHGYVTSPLTGDQKVGQPVHASMTSPVSGDQRFGQLTYRPIGPTTPTVAAMDSSVEQKIYGRPFSPTGDKMFGQQVLSPITSLPSGDQRVGQPDYRLITTSDIASADSSVDETRDSRPLSSSSVTSLSQSAISPAICPFSPSVSTASHQRPSSAPATGGNIQGYRRICFSPIPQSSHRASPVPLMMSQQLAGSDASKESRGGISVSAARLVFTPRRGSDVTAAGPPYLTSSGPARTQLNVLRENQVSDWKDNRRPVVWIPSPPPPPITTGRSQSLEPVSGTAMQNVLNIISLLIYIHIYLYIFIIIISLSLVEQI